MLELREIKSVKTSLGGIIIRIAALMTLVIPLLMLVGTVIYRAVNHFKLVPNEDMLLNRDITFHIASMLPLKDLFAFSRTSHKNLDLVKSILINQLNSGVINSKNLMFWTLSNFINYFGEKCSDITQINLGLFGNYSSTDLDRLKKACPKVEKICL